MLDRFRALWDTLLPIGRDPAGAGWTRHTWSEPDLAFRRWFTAQATSRGLVVETDRNGNLFAWLGAPDAGRADTAGTDTAGTDAGRTDTAGAVITGSHFDSVPHGGAYDGPLGIVSGLLAIEELARRGVRPRRPVAVAAFAEEEGARFGVACLGSRLLTGGIDPERARALTDAGGLSLAAAMTAAGADPAAIGPDPARLAGIGCFVELHIEQGRALAELAAPVGVCAGIWPHGRWRMDITGEGNHAGTTGMAQRSDPMLTAAFAVLAANEEARLKGCRATVGRLSPVPGATNAVPSAVSLWLDARAPDDAALSALVTAIETKVAERARRDGTTMAMAAESTSPAVYFDAPLRDRLAGLLGGAPVLPTAAGHDAGVLAGHVPAAMLFVRNPSGASHTPAEAATDADCVAGVAALADVLEELACR